MLQNNFLVLVYNDAKIYHYKNYQFSNEFLFKMYWLRLLSNQIEVNFSMISF